MKPFRSTQALLLLVMLVVGYAYFFEYKGKIQKEAEDTQRKKIVPFALEDTQEFSVKTFAEEYLFKKVVEGSNSKWIMEKPISDVASTAAIQGFLSQFGKEVYDDIVAEGPDLDFNIYGLNDKDPNNRITTVGFKAKDQVLTIDIGTATAIAGKKYLRLNKEDKVLLAGYFWESQFQKSLSDLREKSFVPPEFSITKIEVKNKSNMSFGLIDGKWVLNELKTNDPEQPLVDDVYYQIKNLRATQIFKEGKSQESLQHLGLSDPEVKVVVYNEAGKKIEFLFSKNMAGQIYATSSERNLIFSLSPQSVKPFNKVVDDFRDKKKPLSFNMAEVQELNFRSSLISFNLKKQNQSWTSSENLNNMEVDNSKVVDILSKLSMMKVAKYFDQEISYQKSGMTELILKTSKGDKILELEWSGRPVEDVFVAKSNLHDKSFGLSMQDVSSLPFQAVIKEKAAAKSETEKVSQ